MDRCARSTTGSADLVKTLSSHASASQHGDPLHLGQRLVERQHRIPGDKFLPYEESLRVPLIMRGPGFARGKRSSGRSPISIWLPPWPLSPGPKPRRRMDGISLLSSALRRHKQIPKRALEVEAPRPLFTGAIPNNAWDRPYVGVRTRAVHVRFLDGDLRGGALRPPHGSLPAPEPRSEPRLRRDQGSPDRADAATADVSRPLLRREALVKPPNFVILITDQQRAPSALAR